MLFESVIFGLLPIIVGILVVAMVFESCWRKCPPDKLMIVSGAGKMRSVSGKGTFVIPLNGLISNPNTDADPAEGMTDLWSSI